MVLRKTLLSLAALGALTSASLMQANADTQLSFTGGVFNFSGSTFSGSGNVVFNFYTQNGVETAFAPPIQAAITLSGTVGTALEGTEYGTQIGIQAPLTNVSESITVVGSNGYGIPAGTNLVSFSNQSATLSGVGKTISFSLASPNNIFSSDVFALYGPENNTLQLTPSSVLSVTGSTTNYGGGFVLTTGSLNAFTATSSSNVFNAASVPEASTLLGLGGLVVGGGLLGLRRRKA